MDREDVITLTLLKLAMFRDRTDEEEKIHKEKKEDLKKDLRLIVEGLKRNNTYKKKPKEILNLLVTYLNKSGLSKWGKEKVFEILKNRDLVYLPNDMSQFKSDKNDKNRSKKYVWEWVWAKALKNYKLDELIREWGLEDIVKDKDFKPLEE